MAFLDAWTRKQGGRRGKLAVRTPTSGLIYGRTRRATSRAGDTNPHDHVLVANVVEMLDDIGGWKALDTAGVRDMVHAATAVTAVLAHPEAIPLIEQPGARNRAWVLASTLAVEHAVADCAERLASGLDGPSLNREAIDDAIVGQERTIGAKLTDGQRLLVEARTTRSLLWRLASGTEHLDRHTVLVIDESSMVDDPTLLKLLVAADAAGSKVIVVGDHHQLGAVGPGGGLEALVDRHPASVHTLTENIRQVDPAERAALEQLRSGDVDRAVSWYAANDRVQPQADRAEAMASMCDRWLTDMIAGHDVAMLAWRRNDVADLNRLARRPLTQAGMLSRERVHTRDGRDYAVGDRVVALSPDPQGRYITSQRGTVTAIERLAPDGPIFTVAFVGGDRPVIMRTTEIGADQLDHAYAVTVHRFQGATVDRTHLDADVPAIDGQRVRPALASPAGPALRLGLLRVERDAVQAIMPPDRFAERSGLGIQSLHLRDQLRELRTGSGRYADTDLGDALRALRAAEAHLAQITHQLEATKLSRRERRNLEHAAAVARADLKAARQTWMAIGADHELDLVAQLDDVTARIDELDATRRRPDPTQMSIQRRLDALDDQITTLEQQLGIGTHQLPEREPPTLGLSL